MFHPATRLLLRDELVGFAKSKVMLVLWVLLPALVTASYFLLPMTLQVDGPSGDKMPMTFLVGMFLASISGTIAALMLAVSVVSERNRKVFELLIVRPVKPEVILISKYMAVFVCVSISCLIATGLGIGVDLIRGVEFPPDVWVDTAKSMGSLLGVISLSAAVGIFFGIVSKSILAAVIWVLYLGQNLTIVPMLPTYWGVLPNLFWAAMALTVVLTALVMFFSIVLFRRAEY